MFCPNCGAKLEDDSLFCEECGQKLEKEDVVPTEPKEPNNTVIKSVVESSSFESETVKENQKHDTSSQNNNSEQDNKKRAIITSIVIGAIILLIIVISVVVSIAEKPKRELEEAQSNFESCSYEYDSLVSDLDSNIEKAKSLLAETTEEMVEDKSTLDQLSKAYETAVNFEKYELPAMDDNTEAINSQISDIESQHSKLEKVYDELYYAIGQVESSIEDKKEAIERKKEEEKQAAYSKVLDTFTFIGKDNMGYEVSVTTKFYGPIKGVTESFKHPAESNIIIPESTSESSYIIPFSIMITNNTSGFDMKLKESLTFSNKFNWGTKWNQNTDYSYSTYYYTTKECTSDTPNAYQKGLWGDETWYVYSSNTMTNGKATSLSWTNGIKPNAAGVTYGYIIITDKVKSPAYPNGIPAEEFPEIYLDLYHMNEGSTNYLTSKKFVFTMVNNNGEKTFVVKEQ